MTLEEARANKGRGVIYRAGHIPKDSAGQPGIIRSVNDTYVFVEYPPTRGAIATRPEDLELEHEPSK
jgi:hypothetical protein